MSRKRNRRRRSVISTLKSVRFSKADLVLIFGVVVAVLVAISVLYQNRPPKPKEPADKYFSFSHAFAIGKPQGSDNSSILVREVYFDITALGGNATDVYIWPLQGVVGQEESPYFGKMSQGKSEVVDLTYPNDVLTFKESNGYPLRFRIICYEAEGTVTVYVTDFTL